ncbi:MAG TPA: 50S ribosomal protein L15 [Candidatus Polarisedimenticolaceae bacterium]|nr:50S ribosomal protein L15 [Candidatus Polarisedimenticolaceae bacterium]
MKIHELTVSSNKNSKRVGRGIGSGKGKTAGRGTKGQNSRSGGGVRPGFEGGQNPLAKRLPKKRGFVPVSRVTYMTVSLTDLNRINGAAVTNAVLVEQKMVKNATAPVKVLGTGELTKKLSVSLQAATKQAVLAIERVGGSFTALADAKKPKKPSKRNRTS